MLDAINPAGSSRTGSTRSSHVMTVVVMVMALALVSVEAFHPALPSVSRSPLSRTAPKAAAKATSTQRYLYVDPDDVKSGVGTIIDKTATLDADSKKETAEDGDVLEAATPETVVETAVNGESIAAANNDEDEEERFLNMINSEVALKKFLGQTVKTARDIPFDILFDRTLDTVEDIVNIVRRKPFDYDWIAKEELEKCRDKTVVVLGSGWASHALIKAADTYSMNLIVVSPVNHFVFTPMLASAAVGSVEHTSMTEAVRASNPMVEYLEGKATDIDVEGKKVTVQLNSLLKNTEDADASHNKDPEPIEIDYDALIVSVGTRVRKSITPGAEKYCHYLKTSKDARDLRRAIGEVLEYGSRPDVSSSGKLNSDPSAEDPTKKEERRRRLRFCIVGGGPSGVELSGELSDFFADVCHPKKGTYPKLKDEIEVLLVHGEDSLVTQFDKNLRDHAFESLQKRGVKVMLNTFTTEVGEDYVILMDRYTGIKERVPVGLTVWAAGIEPVAFSEKMLEQLPESARGIGGRINVDKWMRPPMPNDELMGSIMVMGDAAAFMDIDHGDPKKNSYLPQTAQVAGQQGAYMARLLNRKYNLTMTPPVLQSAASSNSTSDALDNWLRLRGMEEASGFNFLNLGMLAYVGGGDALSQIQIGDVPLFAYFGSAGFVLWRSVYLVKQVATRNRILVAFDWLKTAVFGRDVTRL